ncbi:synembryn-B-like isoform X2 [Gordionus sp. m RMFG-2023]|uniref:synembryn-B-like isoform X2 n=1 Tax=Gordionus sp. m RMFG-2023 TaxID=3053472 RepID=UPI0031FC15EE
MFQQLLKILDDPNDEVLINNNLINDNNGGNRVKKFEKVQQFLDNFVNNHSTDTFIFPELRQSSDSDKERVFSFLFEVLKEEKMAELQILNEENAEINNDNLKNHLGFWSFFSHGNKFRKSSSYNIDYDESYHQDPEFFVNLTALKLTCLKTLRLLSRDKELYADKSMDKIINGENLMILVKLMKTDPTPLENIINEDVYESNEKNYTYNENFRNSLLVNTIPEEEKIQIIEAQKCLCNLVYNDTRARKILASSLAPQIILNRNERFWKIPGNRDLVFFDLRLLFLLSAFESDLRLRLMGFFDNSFMDLTLPKLNDMLDYFAKLESVFVMKDDDEYGAFKQVKEKKGITNETKGSDKTLILATPDQPVQIKRLTLTCRYLLCYVSARNLCQSQSKRMELDSNTINLLTNIPVANYWSLIPLVHDTGDNKYANLKDFFTEKVMNVDVKYAKPGEKKKIGEEVIEKYDMTAIAEILDFLRFQFDQIYPLNSKNISNNDHRLLEREAIVPSLLLFSELAKHVRPIRKYLKSVILPKLTSQDLKCFPETGNTLRNRLCKSMTSHYTDLKELSAELLFTLCKENVDRLVEYTGYGNAAGILARLGLMTGGVGPNRRVYSADSSDNDDEERKNVNPITGRLESEEDIQARQKAFNDLTESEKEQRAIEIAQLLKGMKVTGTLKPVAIGRDGRPIPLDDFDSTI